MIKFSLSTVLVFLTLCCSAQDYNTWLNRNSSAEILKYQGIFNHCVPFKIAIRTSGDSIHGIWQLKGEKAHLLHGVKQEKVAQLIEFNQKGEPTGFFLYRADSRKPRYAYWIDSERRRMRVLPIGYGKRLEKDIHTCHYSRADICVKQIDPYTYKGTIYNRLKNSYSVFRLSDSLYLNTYKSLIPEKENLIRKNSLAVAIKQCVDDVNSTTLQMEVLCEDKSQAYVHFIKPREMGKALQFIYDEILAHFTSWKADIDEKTMRMGFVVETEIIPFHVGEEILSFLVIIHKNDGKKVLYGINWSRKKHRIIRTEDVFKRRFDMQGFITQKSAEVKRGLKELEPQKAGFIEQLNFDHILFSRSGFIFVSQADKNFGWRSFYIPYATLKGEYRWFHPLKDLMRDGNK